MPSVISADGARLYVTGWSVDESGTKDIAVVAYNPVTGEEVWSSRYNGPDNGFDIARDIALSPDGAALFVVGASRTTSGLVDATVIAYETATGAERWVATYDHIGEVEFGTSMSVSPDGNTVFITGQSDGVTDGEFSTDWFTAAYDAATGERKWLSRFDGPSHRLDVPYDLAVSGDRVLVVGQTTPAGTFASDATLAAYDAATGAMSWMNSYDSGSSDAGFALRVDASSGRIYVTGQANRSALTGAYDVGDGHQIWASTYDGSVDDNLDFGTSIELSSDGRRVYVAGRTDSSTTGADYLALGYDTANGSRLWAASYDNSSSHEDTVLAAKATAVSPDGALFFMTGFSYNMFNGVPIDFDIATVAFNTDDGSRRWVARYNGPGSGNDYGAGMSIAPDGSRVFVSGPSWGDGTGQDIATVAYRVSNELPL
jgi:hypothetical protein